MKTCTISINPDSLQYQLFSDRLLELFELNVGLKREDIKTADLKETARNYFLRCDLTEEQVDQLIRNITVQQKKPEGSVSITAARTTGIAAGVRCLNQPIYAGIPVCETQSSEELRNL